MKNTRKILVEFEIHWDDYEDVSDELVIEDAIEIKEGVTYQIVDEISINGVSVYKK